MATVLMPTPAIRRSGNPFYFNSAAHLLRIEREKATTLGELLAALRNVANESIFQHTFQTLEEHHFIREGFSNDFAHWAFAACNEVGLAERLASLDVREFTSIRAIRERIVEIVEDYLKKNPRSGDRAALEPFYFCASDTVVVPTPFVARNLQEFAEGLQKVSIHAIHYHFIEARPRLKLNTNDYSQWLDEELDLGLMADKINRIDIYTSTLQDVRRAILRVVQPTAMAA